MKALAAGGFLVVALSTAVAVPGRPALELQAIVAILGAVLLWAALWASAADRGALTSRREPARLAWGIAVVAALVSTSLSDNPWGGIVTVGATAAAAAAHAAVSNGVLPRAFLQSWGGLVLVGGSALSLCLPAVGLRPSAGSPLSQSEWIAATGALALPWAVPWVAGGFGGNRGLYAIGFVPLLAVIGGRFAGLPAAGLGIAVVVTASLTRRRLAYAAVGIAAAALAGLGAWKLGIDLPRDAWGAAARMGVGHPVAGHGPGTFETTISAFGPASPHAQSGLLHLWAEQGALGVLAAVLLVYVVLRRWMFFVRRQQDAAAQAATAAAGGSVFAMVVLAVFQPWFLSPAHVVQFGLVTGILEYVGNRRPLSRPREVKAGATAVFAAVTVLLIVGGLNAQRRLLGSWAYAQGMAASDPKVKEDRLRACVEWDARHWRGQRELGRFLVAEGKPYDAAGTLEQGLEIAPYDVESLVLLAEAYAALESPQERAKHRDRALEALDRAERLDPSVRRDDLRRRFDAGS